MFAIPYNPSDPLKDIVTEPLTRVAFFIITYCILN